ncbi:cache domain-containing protein [Noviherbaspirillum autotrophicum]|uniref:Histidine kinase n=1 Tax=Noviherbaspirillum autotrophicum TaxID=709839 RepID=A0A0C1XZB5_9BURK|nr:cache domain-containing protein [Noviherbaspirillum autotrophicum]KIF80118.1 histidine kinase [Noviherbaspirillum autotrophicum]
MQKLFNALLLSLGVLVLGSAGAADKTKQEEAVALVKKAAAYLNANGKEKALAEFSNPKGQFVERDLYVFVNDLNGNTMAHGGNPKLIGKNVIELKDADGKLFIKEMSELAKTKGKGWVDYKWPNPVTKAIEEKTTYIERVGDVMIGCGIYK